MEPAKTDLDTPVALVTGAAQRIGAGIVTCLHAAGYNIVLHYCHSAPQAIELAENLNQIRKDSVRLVQADLLHIPEITELATQSLAQWQRLDLLVNNASLFYPTPLAAATCNDWEKLMGSNALAPFLLTQQLAATLAINGGSIVNISDSTAELGVSSFTPYTMAKAALNNMTRSLARELAPRIRVNSVAPGVILWPEYQGGVTEEEKSLRLKNTALGREGSIEDVAAAVLFLARATYITGQVLRVDGGAALYHY